MPHSDTNAAILSALSDPRDASAYLKSDVLCTAIDGLFYARRAAGLSQEQVGIVLHKKQEAIARWESDTEGRLSLEQYVDLAMAVGMVPHIVLVPFEEARQRVIQELLTENEDR